MVPAAELLWPAATGAPQKPAAAAGDHGFGFGPQPAAKRFAGTPAIVVDFGRKKRSRRSKMFSSAFKDRLIATSVLAGLAAAASVGPARAQQNAPLPDFSSNEVGWVGTGAGGNFSPVPGALPPVDSDPAHPYVPNQPIVPGRQPTYRIADRSNPQPRP
jgi:hypothetical protein